MSDYIKREDAIQALISVEGIKGFEFRQLEKALETLPGVDINGNGKWNKCEEVVPTNDRLVICRGLRGGAYIGKYRDGYYWFRPTANGGDCSPVEWIDIPE